MRQALLTITVLSLHATFTTHSVQISSLNVPPVVINGSSRVLLDCDYSLMPNEEGLVVRWLLNDNFVYQWIPKHVPQGLGALRGRVEPGAGAVSTPTAHRTLYIRTPTTDLSGEWKCVVSTFTNEDFMKKKMIVFAPEKKFELKQTPALPDGITNVTCTATGVFPEPRLSLYGDRGSSSMRSPLAGVTVQTKARTADYDVTAWALVNISSIQERGITTVTCLLRVPDANYSRFESLVLQSGLARSSSLKPHLICHLIAVFLCIGFRSAQQPK